MNSKRREARKFSTCTIVWNALEVGLPVFENVAAWLPFADECLVVDVGSADGTRELLAEIAAANPKLRVLDYRPDADYGAALTAHAMTFGLKRARNELVMTSSADEVYHEGLVKRTVALAENGARYILYMDWKQITRNFQEFKGFNPERMAGVQRDEVAFRTDGAFPEPDPVDSVPGLEWKPEYVFTHWARHWLKPTIVENGYHVFDVSGCFRDNMAARYRAHLKMWTDNPAHVLYEGEYLSPEEWQERLKDDPAWEAKISPYDDILPASLKGLVGTTKYAVRPGLVEAMKEGRPYP